MKINEIENWIDNLPEKRGKKMKRIRNKRVMITVFAVFIAVSVIASAALLSFFGQVTVTADVQQSIVIQGVGDTEWRNFDEGIQTNIPDMVHCTPYLFKYWIWNRACADAEVDFDIVWNQAPENNPDGYEYDNWILGDTQTIGLWSKDVNWQPIEQIADLTFNTCGPTFDYTLDVYGLCDCEEEQCLEYALIYYPDEDPRFDAWGGDGGMVLTRIACDGTYTGSLQLHTLPYETDWNAGPDADYCVSDGYEHCKGAKFWLVPTSYLTNEEELPLVDWNQEAFFFEDDLGLYVDCDEIPPVNLVHVYPLFTTNVLKSDEVYCWINYNHVPMNIMPGIYEYVTRLVLLD